MISNELTSFILQSKKGGIRSGKDNARNEVTKSFFQFFMENGISRPAMLTLPSAWWKFEKKMNERIFKGRDKFKINRSVYVGCELDWKIFSLASIRIPLRGNRMIRQKLNEELNCQVVTNGDDHLIINTDIFDLMKSNGPSNDSERKKRFHGIWLDLTQPVDRFYDKLINIGSAAQPACIVVITFLKGREVNGMHTNRTQVIDREMKLIGFAPTHSLEYNDGSPMIQLTYQRIVN